MDMLKTVFLTVFFFFFFFFFLFYFIFVRKFFRITVVYKFLYTLLRFGTAICMSGQEFLKKIAYNTFFAVNVRLAILGLLHVLEPISCYQLSALAHKNGPMSHHQL